MLKISKINFSDILSSEGAWSFKSIKMLDHFLGALIAFILPKQTIHVSSNQSIRQILVIRPGGIGDAVFLLPILKLLKAQGVSVDILCESRNAEVFVSQGYSVYFYNQFESLGQVLRNSYDAVVDTEQWHYTSAIISYFLKTKYRIGFATRTLRAKLFNKQVVYGDNDYELDNFLKLFDGFLSSQQVIQNINDSFDIPQSFQIWASEQIPEDSVTVFLGASIALRRLSKEQLLDIINDLLSKGFCPVLLGGKDVLDVARQILEETEGKKVLNFVGKVSLIESAALIQRARRFIGPDSGLMHLACSVGTSVTAVFGPGHLKKWNPRGDQHKILTVNASCSPCTRFGNTVPTCHGSYFCMKNIKYNGDLG